ncbi:MAG TPA: ATP-binding protein [Polyangia bacterium]|nr:ATP-binding protein [Polyangia bacterium]
MTSNDSLRFARRLLVPDVLLLLVELGFVFAPLVTFFDLDPAQRAMLPHLLAVVFPLALAVWLGVTRFWRAPLARACRRRLAGETVDNDTRFAAYAALRAYPRRALALRVALWSIGAAAVAIVLNNRAGFPRADVFTVIAVASTHAFGIAIFRALAYERILERTRASLLPDLDGLRIFADAYHERLLHAAFATGACGIFGIAAFTYFFIPVNLEQYVRLETFYPITVAALTGAWLAYLRAVPRPIDRYLDAALSRKPADQLLRDDPRALAAYRAAQSIPYKLALAKVAFWLVAELALVMQGVWFFGMDLENAALMCGAAVVVTIGAALYEALWDRAIMRPLLVHIAARHRPAPEKIRTPLSLRSKMLAGFGALTFFACGMSLFLSYMQYKTMATGFIGRESELRLDSTLAELRERGASHPLTRDELLKVLDNAVRWKAPKGSVQDEAVIYYLPPEEDSKPIALGGGKHGAPPLPWTGEALMHRLERGAMQLDDNSLTGAYARLYVGKQDFGSIALLLPGYRGRGPDLAPQVKILIYFFFVLLTVSMGLVILVATDLTRPIRDLERRADAMAKGDLVRPVISHSGEADEVGRLTYAFEEMRRALNDKLRSSTEINLSLEQEVTRRTAELERRNTELNTALAELRRTQDELVRSEKMASMGRLVAGIAHEINNPVNAVVNTVGPLEQTLATLSVAPDSQHDLSEMIRVIQRGARRTKEIVQALHNYSRGDDDRLVDVDLQRGIDDSLDLLRHHLKNGITVERQYGDVGRVRGHAGQLHQVFMNLLTNAAQALGERGDGGLIRIATERKEGKAVITVADDGPGIPAEVLPRIFDPFFTTKEVGQGSGLGLSIVHGIVERHGGTIAVDSTVGKGTTFTVSLPAE